MSENGLIAGRNRVARASADGVRASVRGNQIAAEELVQAFRRTGGVRGSVSEEIGRDWGVSEMRRVLLDGVRRVLGQAFRRAPGVLDSRCWVPDRITGSQIGYGSRLGLGLRWTGLDLGLRLGFGLSEFFFFLFSFNQN